MNRKLFLAAFAIVAVCSCSGSASLADLKCEYLHNPTAIDSAEPHFNWKIESGSPLSQASYEIEVASSRFLLSGGRADLWKSGKVASSDQVMVPYSGTPLKSRQQCWWKVRIWDDEGKASRWSRPQHFGIGVLAPDSLAGEYIGAVPGEGRSALLRKKFEVRGRFSDAILYVNSLGYHEAYLNGKKVSDAVLTPAVSDLRKRSLIVAYDVSRLIHRGSNEIVLWTGSGWYKPGTFDACYDGALVKAELDLFVDGKPECAVCTDGSWNGRWSGYSDTGSWKPGKFAGEKIDAAVVPLSLSSSCLDTLEWTEVDVVKIDGMKATPQSCELCFFQEELNPVDIRSWGDSVWTVDFGRVMNGMLEIHLPSLPAGTGVKVSFADEMEGNGRLQTVGYNTYISSGSRNGDVFRDKFNHHVFRYLRIENLPEKPDLSSIVARRMRTGYESAVRFECSDKDMNDIFNLVRYTMENLAFDGYMVDCANIERLGYGGDGNASTLSLQAMFDVAPLYVNWLEAWNDSVREDGGLPHVAPAPYSCGGGPYWCGFIVQAPWRTYMSYADDRMIGRCYPFMKKWLEYVDAYTVDGLLRRWPDLPYRNWYLGDWAAPDGVDVTAAESVDLVNNCSLCQVCQDLVRIAEMVGTASEKEEFQRRYDSLVAKINSEFWHPADSTYGTGTQIDMVYPMLVGAVPDEIKPLVRKKLFERTESVYGGNLSTGLVGVPVIAEWATLDREADFMYGMLKEEDYPGYLYMLRNGATGTWEHWNAHRSRLHNCFNGIGSWFIQALGGLAPTSEGYRTVSIEPQLPCGIDWVTLEKETPYGTVCVSSRRTGNGIHLDVEIPVGVTADIAGKQYGSGCHRIDI